MWLSLGCYPEYREYPDGRQVLYNTHYIINQDGAVESKYRKLHLFDIQLAKVGGMDVSETDIYTPGKEVARPCFSPVGYLGLSISYDLRFPELYRSLTLKGA